MDSSQKLRLNNDFLNLYLEMVEDTESPRIFHIWSALAGISACLGRRVFLRRGPETIFANMFVSLVGPPGVRKSTAMNIMRKRVKAATDVRFAPDDTGGQRQGLIKAMQNKKAEADHDKDLVDAAAHVSAESLLNTRIAVGSDPRDLHTIFVCASEFNSFLGRNALDMFTFLVKMFDGEDYEYRLKKDDETVILTDPLISLIGCTTPTNIATAFPNEAIGQGFTSRIIFAHSNKKYKSVPRPQSFDDQLTRQVEAVYERAFFKMDGQIVESKKAARLADELYERPAAIDDPRFLYYAERRQTHLLKTSIVLAATRGSTFLEEADLLEADKLLRATEATMPEAFGEYGLSKSGAARQKMLEFMQHVKAPVTNAILYAMLARDMSLPEYQSAVADFTNSGKFKQVSTNQGPAYVYVDAATASADQILLAEVANHDNSFVDDDDENGNVIPLRKEN